MGAWTLRDRAQIQPQLYTSHSQSKDQARLTVIRGSSGAHFDFVSWGMVGGFVSGIVINGPGWLPQLAF